MTLPISLSIDIAAEEVRSNRLLQKSLATGFEEGIVAVVGEELDFQGAVVLELC
jgi:hypothetical protein